MITPNIILIEEFHFQQNLTNFFASCTFKSETCYLSYIPLVIIQRVSHKITYIKYVWGIHKGRPQNLTYLESSLHPSPQASTIPNARLLWTTPFRINRAKYSIKVFSELYCILKVHEVKKFVRFWWKWNSSIETMLQPDFI